MRLSGGMWEICKWNRIGTPIDDPQTFPMKEERKISLILLINKKCTTIHRHLPSSSGGCWGGTNRSYKNTSRWDSLVSGRNKFRWFTRCTWSGNGRRWGRSRGEYLLLVLSEQIQFHSLRGEFWMETLHWPFITLPGRISLNRLLIGSSSYENQGTFSSQSSSDELHKLVLN